MTETAVEELNSFLGEVAVDRIGIVRLNDWQDTPMWRKAKELLPQSKCIIVLALEVFPEVVKYLTSQAKVGEVTLRDLYSRNAELVNGHLDWESYKTVRKLHQLGFKGLPLPAGGAPFDDRLLEGTFSYKHTAQAAGLGILGWHSMLLTPEYGARVRLACIITDASLSPSASVQEGTPCPECGGACIKICPVSAIRRPRRTGSYKIDKYACSTYYNASGGCSECLKVCLADKISWHTSP